MKTIIILISLLLHITIGFSAQNIDEIPDISQERKIYYLSMLWKEVDYNYPFFNRLEDYDLDKTYLDHLELALQTESIYDYYQVLQRFMATLRDCNTRIVLPQAISSQLNYPLIMLEDMDDKIIITNIGKRFVDDVPIGSELTHIEGIPVNRYLEDKVSPYISASTDEILRQKSLLFAFLGLENREVSISIKTPEGSSARAVLVRNWRDDSWAEFIWQKQMLLHRWIDDDIVFLEINRFDDVIIHRKFKNIHRDFANAQGLILDLRENSYGFINIAYDMLQWFTTAEKLPYPLIKSRKHVPLYKAFGTPSFWYGLHANPEYEGYGRKDEWIEEDPIFYDNDPEHERFIIPTVILTGHKTAAPAEEMVMVMSLYRDDVKIAGTNSSGRRGQALTIALPLMGQAWITTSKDTFPDGRILSRTGITPDIEVSQTYQDYLDGKDTVVEQAVRALREMLENR